MHVFSYRRSGNFHVKNNLCKKLFVLINFHGSFDLQKFCLTVDSYIMDKCLERFYHLVYYQVLGEPAIAGCNAVAVRRSHRSHVYPGRCGREQMLIIAA